MSRCLFKMVAASLLGCCLQLVDVCSSERMTIPKKLTTYSNQEIFDHLIAPSLEFYPELIWLLSQKTETTGESNYLAQRDSWSKYLIKNNKFKHLINHKSIEFERTISSIVFFYLLLDSSPEAYERMVKIQPNEVRLSFKNFYDLSEFAKKTIRDDLDYLSMLSYLIYSDLGKTPQLKKSLEKFSSTQDHDDAIKILFNQNNAVIELILPSFKKFPESTSMAVKDLFKLNSLHWGHALHLEGGEHMFSNFSATTKLYPIKISKYLRFLYLAQLLDVAGATGHITISGSLSLTEQTYINYKMLYKEICSLTKHHCSSHAYNAYFNARCQGLNLNCENLNEQVLARLGIFLRFYTHNDGELLKASAKYLTEKEWNYLISMFAIDRGINRWQRNPTYMPTVLINVFKPLASAESKGKRLEKTLIAASCLAKVLSSAELKGYSKNEEPLNMNPFAKSVSTLSEEWFKACNINDFIIENHQLMLRKNST